MPITENELRGANQAMLGNTNRGLLFATVNVSKDAPRLEEMLARLQAGVVTWEQFSAQVREKLTVKSFPEFITKFQPCFYYRLRPPPGSVAEEEGEQRVGLSGRHGLGVVLEDPSEGPRACRSRLRPRGV